MVRAFILFFWSISHTDGACAYADLVAKELDSTGKVVATKTQDITLD